MMARKVSRQENATTRQGLSADGLFSLVRKGFEKIFDDRPAGTEISLADALMSGFAMFSLKDPSLLAFEQRRNDENLKSVYHIENIPCDTHLRTILDSLDPESLRPLFKDVFRRLQRGKALEPFVFYEGCYLLSLDGTGYFSSSKVHCPSCMQKTSRSGKVTYYHQMLGAAIVHPDFKEVIPLMPEPIIKQDGETKNDCERNAGKRFFHKLRRDHPHLKLIVIEDALSSNAPHIRELQDHNLHYILGVKEGDHGFLFDQVRRAESAGQVTVTDFPLDEQNVGEIMRGGHGQQNLSVVFAMLMMLAFLVDQTQQLCCPLFQDAWKEIGSKKMLWERMRSFFGEYIVSSMQEVFAALAYGYKRPRPVLTIDSS